MIGLGGHARVAAGRRQRVAQPLFHLFAHPGDAALLEQEGQPGAAAGLARAVIAKGRGDDRADLGRFLRSHEGVERLCEDRAAGALLAADGDVEARAVAGHRRRHRDVLRLAARAVLETPGDRDVELARQVGELLVAEEDRLEGRRHPGGVDQLARREPGGRAADDAADVVHTGLQAGEAGRLQARDHLGDLLDRHPAQLHLLARGHVGDRPAGGAPRFLGDLAEQPRLGRRHDAVRHADAHHEMAGRRLAVEDADPLQPLLVVVGDGLPALAREAHEVLGHVEPVLFRLQGLDAVHGLRSSRRRRTAQAFSSGCRERGSRVLSVRLLALL